MLSIESWKKFFELPKNKGVILVNPVNCCGVMGAGLALEVGNRWPKSLAEYKKVCADMKLNSGGVLRTEEVEDGEAGVILYHAATKRHWRDKSLIEDIELCVRRIGELALLEAGGFELRVPALGCGLGGLRWEDVSVIIFTEFSKKIYDDMKIIIYEPYQRRNS